jgi:hypothetical protein
MLCFCYIIYQLLYFVFNLPETNEQCNLQGLSVYNFFLIQGRQYNHLALTTYYIKFRIFP